MKYLMFLSYIGDGFRGFQVQNGSKARTVQGELCRAASELFGVACAVSGCSRTDSGVHARKYVATLEAKSDTVISPRSLPRAMNSKLNGDIVVYDAKIVDDDYSVRRHVWRKEYEYIITDAPYPSPFYLRRAWHYGARKLDVDKMNKAAAHFVGTHDFRAFMASGSDIENTVRTIERCEVFREGDIVKVRVKADGFLYNMVRIIVGTLVEVSEGKIVPDDILGIIASRERKNAGRTAPPDGLYLFDVTLN